MLYIWNWALNKGFLKCSKLTSLFVLAAVVAPCGSFTGRFRDVMLWPDNIHNWISLWSRPNDGLFAMPWNNFSDHFLFAFQCSIRYFFAFQKRQGSIVFHIGYPSTIWYNCVEPLSEQFRFRPVLLFLCSETGTTLRNYNIITLHTLHTKSQKLTQKIGHNALKSNKYQIWCTQLTVKDPSISNIAARRN